MEPKKVNQKILVGKVTSDKMEKTITVAIDRIVQHKKYKKTLKRSTNVKAHDEENTCKTGDMVKIAETRPLSKTKRWKVVEVVAKANIGDVTTEIK